MRIQTKDLTDLALDWAVAFCENQALGTEQYNVLAPLEEGQEKYSPSTNGSQGVEIIEREKLLPCYAPDGGDNPGQPWVCDDYAGQVPSGVYWGETMLIAAMRCYVASKLGDWVDVPDELFA